MTAQQRTALFQISLGTIVTMLTIAAAFSSGIFWISGVGNQASAALAGQDRIIVQIEELQNKTSAIDKITSDRSAQIERSAAIFAEQLNSIRLTVNRIERKMDSDEAKK